VLGVGEVELGKKNFLFSQKIAQVLVKWTQRALSFNILGLGIDDLLFPVYCQKR
jgi:hypothetical protein